MLILIDIKHLVTWFVEKYFSHLREEFRWEEQCHGHLPWQPPIKQCTIDWSNTQHPEVTSENLYTDSGMLLSEPRVMNSR